MKKLVSYTEILDEQETDIAVYKVYVQPGLTERPDWLTERAQGIVKFWIEMEPFLPRLEEGAFVPHDLLTGLVDIEHRNGPMLSIIKAEVVIEVKAGARDITSYLFNRVSDAARHNDEERPSVPEFIAKQLSRSTPH